MQKVVAISSSELHTLPKWTAYKKRPIGHADTGLLLHPAVFSLDGKHTSGLLFYSEARVQLALLLLGPLKLGVFELSGLKAKTKYGAIKLEKYSPDLRTSSVRLSMMEPLYHLLTSSNVKWLKSGTDIVTYDPKLFIAFKFWMRTEATAKELLEAYNKFNDLYHNQGKSPLTDKQFDDLGDILEQLRAKPNTVGATPTRDKVTLPMSMGSQVKIKQDGKSLKQWLKLAGKSSVVKSLKYDGISILLHYEKGKLIQAYTRGDGTKGRIVTHQVQAIPDVPKTLTDKTDKFIRAEIIMTKAVFEKNYKSSDTPSARNMVAGLLNRKAEIPKSIASHLHVVAFEIMNNNKDQDKADQLAYLAKLGFRTAEHSVHNAADLDEDELADHIAKYKAKGPYDIDGLVLDVNHASTRNKLGLETNSLNPKYARAFKADGTDEKVETVVREVLFRPSKDGYLKPRVRVDPVFLAGAKVSYASAFNAKYILDNKINVGTVITLTRSGGVIPDIQEVIKPSKIAAVPDPMVYGDYKLNKSGVDWVLTGQSDAVDLQRIIHFFKTINTFGAADGIFKKLYDNGFTTLISIMKMTAQDFEELPGMKERSAEKAYAAIHKALHNVTMPQLMDASSCFGRALGEGKLEKIYAKYGDKLLTDTKTNWGAKIAAMHGFADNTAQMFAAGLPLFRQFLVKHQNYIKVVKPAKIIGKFSGQIITPTGFRDKTLFAEIEKQGGKVADGLSKATTLLLTKDKQSSVKTEKAKSLGIPTMTLDAFKSQYRL